MLQERPYSRYTREKTWAALYSQHINGCYALVPFSATNNSIAVIRCASPEETAATARDLLEKSDECEAWYAQRLSPDSPEAPALLRRARQAVVLARSSDYYRYHLTDHPDFRLVICGLHDSYLHLVTWETSSNRRYSARASRLAIGEARATPTGHSILVGALICGNTEALALLADRAKIPERTARRIRAEFEELQHRRYQGRPLAFLTEAKRLEIGSKISAGLRAYHARWRA